MPRRSLRTFLVAASMCAATMAISREAGAQVQQAGSPVVDLLTKAKNALNDLSYARADTLVRQVLALGSLVTAEQQLAALQIQAAAFYPEEAADRKTDSAVAAIRRMVAAGGNSVPKDISWAGLDSLVVLVAKASEPAKVVLGSRIPGAVVYVNGAPQGLLAGLRTVVIPPAVMVKIEVRAEKCVSWDTTMVARAADSVRVGIRNPKCQP